MALTQKRFVFERNGHDKKFFQSWGLLPVPFYDRGDIKILGVLREARAPGFFFILTSLLPPQNLRSPMLSVIKHSLFLSIRDYGISRIFFSTKKSYIQVYHDRITRAAHQKMTTIHIIFQKKN